LNCDEISCEQQQRASAVCKSDIYRGMSAENQNWHASGDSCCFRIARQHVTRCFLFGPRHVPSAIGMHATIGELCEKIPGREPHGAWRQDELTGGKLPVVK
jgi:hypothetical protein